MTFYVIHCYQRNATLLDVPLQVWIKFYPNKRIFFFSRMCSLRLKGEVEIIPLNYLSVPENVFQEVCWGFSCRIAIDYFSGVRCFSW